MSRLAQFITLLTLLTVNSLFAAPVMIDVFANVESVNQTINKVNASFSDAGIYSKYHITPLINSHKVHLTMYLTEYDESYVPIINDTVSKLAIITKPFIISDRGLTLESSNFLMLNVEKNLQLQILSDKISASLMCYRNKNSIIPSWAINNVQKSRLFYAYGSPNVFDGFDPHFSIFVAKVSSHQQQQFVADVNSQLAKLNLAPSDYRVSGLGVAKTDKNGQIINVLGYFPFNQD